MLQNLSVSNTINYDRMASCGATAIGHGNMEKIKTRTQTKDVPGNSVKSRFELLKTLGKGTYGKVKLAIDRTTGQKVAIKTILKDKVKERDDMKHILREMEIMRALKHSHIIQVYDVYQNHDRIVIVMEYAPGGELFDYLANQKSISEVEARSLFTQIVSAVQHCHRNGIVHRDLKLENILLGDHNEIKIADFGLANKYTDRDLLSTFCGSPLYASPEIINGIPYVGPEVDSWSLGVLLYSLVYCMMPFDGSDYATLTKQISKGEFTKPSRHSDALSLIKELLQVDPKLRISVEDITKHEWMQMESTQAKPTNKPCSLDANGNIIDDKQSTDIAHCDVNNTKQQTMKKSILKRKDSDQTSDSDSSILSNPVVHNVVTDDVFACGLQAKDSLKLKVKPHGSSHKRRVMRPKRDRESGYYSSPERNHELSTLPPAGQVPMIKPVLTPHKSNRRASAKTRSHNSPQFDEMLENFTASIPRKNNDDCSTSLSHHKQQRTQPVTIPRSTVKRSRGSETPPEALTPTSAHLVAELQRILPSRDGAKHHRRNDVNIYNSYEYLPQNQTDNFSTELDAMMRQLNLELEEAYENAINRKSSYATV